MSFLINKVVALIISPLGIGLLLILIALIQSRISSREKTSRTILLALIWFYLSSIEFSTISLSMVTTGNYYATYEVEDIPSADAIVILGGGMVFDARVIPYPDMNNAGDRVIHAARLWKAGKAPKIVISGKNDNLTTLPLLNELGVKEEAIYYDNKSRNTQENAIEVARLLSKENEPAPPKVLVVTSVWHMKRALLIFKQYAPHLEAIPAPTDFDATMGDYSSPDLLVPKADSFDKNSRLFKELVGYNCYRLKTLFHRH